MTALSLSRLHYPVTTLGPGLRLGIWFQGCSIRCEGCVSMDTWAPGHGMTTVDAVIEAAVSALREADGTTISGGEPFDQANALRDLLGRVKALSRGDVLVYTGYPFEALQGRLGSFEGLIDCLVTDPFDRGAAQTLPLRGGDNQRLWLLTEIGRERFRRYETASEGLDRTLDVMFDDHTGEVFLAGIPKPGDMRRLARLLATAGHLASTTEDKRQAS